MNTGQLQVNWRRCKLDLEHDEIAREMYEVRMGVLVADIFGREDGTWDAVLECDPPGLDDYVQLWEQSGFRSKEEAQAAAVETAARVGQDILAAMRPGAA